jgi:hypothetical protein
MRSKWLDWQAKEEILRKVEPQEPAKPAEFSLPNCDADFEPAKTAQLNFAGFAGSPPSTVSPSEGSRVGQNGEPSQAHVFSANSTITPEAAASASDPSQTNNRTLPSCWACGGFCLFRRPDGTVECLTCEYSLTPRGPRCSRVEKYVQNS